MNSKWPSTLAWRVVCGLCAGVANVKASTAGAADLPTVKAATIAYVRTCNVGGMAGFVIPGSDTCLNISGYIQS